MALARAVPASTRARALRGVVTEDRSRPVRRGFALLHERIAPHACSIAFRGASRPQEEMEEIEIDSQTRRRDLPRR
jgi:hypothetical protein